MGLRLGCVNQIRKFHCVLNEENWDVVADQIPVTLVGVELDSKTSNIAHCIGRAAFTNNGREAYEDRRPLAGLVEQRRSRIFLKRLVAFEITMGGRTAGM